MDMIENGGENNILKTWHGLTKALLVCLEVVLKMVDISNID